MWKVSGEGLRAIGVRTHCESTIENVTYRLEIRTWISGGVSVNGEL